MPNVIGIRIERKRLRLPPGSVVDDLGCLDNVQSCCQEYSGSVEVSCCPGVQLPRTLYASFVSRVSLGITECPCIDGLTVTLLYDGLTWWSNPDTTLPSPCTPMRVMFGCGPPGQMVLRLFCPGADDEASYGTLDSCSPLLATFTAGIVPAYCCGGFSAGYATVTVTE